VQDLGEGLRLGKQNKGGWYFSRIFRHAPASLSVMPRGTMIAGRVLGFVAAAAAFSCALAQQISIPSAKQEEILRRTSNTWNKPLTFPSRLPEVTATLVEYPPGTSAERQINRYSRYLYVLEGTLTLNVEGRGPVAFPAGSMIISGNTWLTPKNNGAVTAKLLVIDQTEAGESNVLLEKPEK
jgi:quercetin dioxygenase-like cupin family protein